MGEHKTDHSGRYTGYWLWVNYDPIGPLNFPSKLRYFFGRDFWLTFCDWEWTDFRSPKLIAEGICQLVIGRANN